MFINRYYTFVLNYKYGGGFLSYYSDPPYEFLEDALLWVKTDAQKNNHIEYKINGGEEDGNLVPLGHTASYILKNVLEEEYLQNRDYEVNYSIHFSPLPEDNRIINASGIFVLAAAIHWYPAQDDQLISYIRVSCRILPYTPGASEYPSFFPVRIWCLL